MKKLPLNEFEAIKSSGHGVPRDKSGYIVPFKVGYEYTIGNIENNETLKVRCTQNSPYHLRVL
jgi:hypothetical protein